MVESDEKLAERVTFIHERIGTAAIAEQYIEGREIYVGVLGNDRRRVLPIWELQFGDLAAGHAADRHREGQARPRISAAPRHRAGRRPRACRPELRARIDSMVKRICRTLELDGYAASTSAWRPTARRISSRPIPIPRSRKRGIRPVRAARRDQVSRPAQPHPAARDRARQREADAVRLVLRGNPAQDRMADIAAVEVAAVQQQHQPDRRPATMPI